MKLTISSQRYCARETASPVWDAVTLPQGAGPSGMFLTGPTLTGLSANVWPATMGAASIFRHWGKFRFVGLYVGTSGWQYKHWKGRFYPENLKPSEWLFHYSSHFRTVEVNNTFYRLPESPAFTRWAESTPPDFIFAIKASRYLTHIKRLKDSTEPISKMMERAADLGPKLGPVLLQLPPSFQAEPDSLNKALSGFRTGQKVAVEFRHPSWQTDEVRRILEKHGAAVCLADRGGRPVGPAWRTADWSYLRLHFGTGKPTSCYGRSALTRWAERLTGGWRHDEDLYVYFNNDGEGCAVRDAVVFAAVARRLGLNASLTPSLAQAPVG